MRGHRADGDLGRLDASEEGHARVNLVDVTINGAAATWDSSTGKISGGGIVLPSPVIAIEPDAYAARAVPQDRLPPGVTIAYLYTREVGGTTDYLSEQQALGIARREVSMAPLDVLSLQSGWASVYVQRNLALFPIGSLKTIRTNDAFLFQTPEVRFAEPIVPRLSYESFSLDAMTGAKGDLDARLTSFFKSLYAGDAKTAVDVSMQGLYSYELVSGQPSFPRVRLPINLLTPSPCMVDPDVKPDFIAPFATVVSDWRATHGPTTDGAARLEIELKVFGAVGEAKQPLIQIGRMTQDVERAPVGQR